MDDFYKPLAERKPDRQYGNSLRYILKNGIPTPKTWQGVAARTCPGTLPQMVFDLENGIPLITERKIAFWQKAIAEIIAFINGARTIDEIESFGCTKYWDAYRGRGVEFGLEPNDMGPGSYGAAFHDFPMPNGATLNQFELLVNQIKKFPYARTLLVTPWVPYYTASGPNRKVIVAPCHGWVQVRILSDNLYMRMDQRSADMPIGVPSNTFQYAALMLMLCQVTGYRPGMFVHSFGDAHIYENQIDNVAEIISRDPRPFPVLKLDPSVTNLFDFRVEHFTLEEYDPHPAINDIPVSP